MKTKNYLWLVLICMSFVANAQEYGKAIFLGDNFHNLQMASGEIYNKNTMFIAGHKDHPFGTKLKITNTANGQSAIATVKDRGPFVTGKIVVVSRKVGELIGMVYDNEVSVKVEVVGAGTTSVATTTTAEETPKPRAVTPPVIENTTKGSNTPKEYNTTTTKPATAEKAAKSTWKPAKKSTATGNLFKADILSQAKSGYGVQVGVFSDLDSVIERIIQLKGIGFTDVFFTIDTQNGKTTHKIIIGNYPTQEQTTAYKKALRSKYKLDGFVVDFSEL
jgi:rare lipoprotein A